MVKETIYTQQIRRLTQTEYETLKQSILRNGLLEPIKKAKNGDIIDGYHRAKITEELGLPCSFEIIDGSEEDLKRIAIELNFARRHLTADERRKIVVERSAKGESERQIAKNLRLSKTTVHNDLRRGPNGPPSSPVIGIDGKTYSRTKPKKTQVRMPPKPETPEYPSIMHSATIEKELDKLTITIRRLKKEVRTDFPPHEREIIMSSANKLQKELSELVSLIRPAKPNLELKK